MMRILSEARGEEHRSKHLSAAEPTNCGRFLSQDAENVATGASRVTAYLERHPTADSTRLRLNPMCLISHSLIMFYVRSKAFWTALAFETARDRRFSRPLRPVPAWTAPRTILTPTPTLTLLPTVGMFTLECGPLRTRSSQRTTVPRRETRMTQCALPIVHTTHNSSSSSCCADL